VEAGVGVSCTSFGDADGKILVASCPQLVSAFNERIGREVTSPSSTSADSDAAADVRFVTAKINFEYYIEYRALTK